MRVRMKRHDPRAGVVRSAFEMLQEQAKLTLDAPGHGPGTRRSRRSASTFHGPGRRTAASTPSTT